MAILNNYYRVIIFGGRGEDAFHDQHSQYILVASLACYSYRNNNFIFGYINSKGDLHLKLWPWALSVIG